jgi:glutathione synthase/RimK-type ligase-like ATP-grasp enzyme
LGFADIPHVEHRLFLHPNQAEYISSVGNWPEIINFAQKHNFNLVCKPNQGTGGNGVFHVQDQLSLEKTVHQLFSSHRAICLSPFENISHEYRVYLLNNKTHLIYEKILPTYPEEGLTPTWKHNLGQGASPKIITDKTLLEKLKKLAQVTAKTLDLFFGAIDIINSDNKLMVLEVNSGIMMESFAGFSTKNYNIAKSIYSKALTLTFEKNKLVFPCDKHNCLLGSP